MKYLTSRLAMAALVAGSVVVATADNARAATLDCSVTAGVCTGGATVVDGGNTYYSFAGALWTTSDYQATGSGVIDSFVRISDNADVVSGMNTDARPLPQDENSSPTFTHDIQGVNVPVVTIAGVQYYEFLLDINQTGVDPKLSLSELELCASATGDRTITGTATTCAGTNIYSLDGAGDNNVVLNYNFNSGSGSGDLFVYIPVSALVTNSTFIYLWSEFGTPPPDNNNDGYEEWAVRTPNPISPIPEPASLLLLGTGLAGVARAVRRRTRKVAVQA